MTVQRFAVVIGVRPEGIAEYEQIHRAVPAAVLATITACSIRNYSIYRYGDVLFGYYEYTGTDHDRDMARMAADPATQQWWTRTLPLQAPLGGGTGTPEWQRLPEAFHLD